MEKPSGSSTILKYISNPHVKGNFLFNQSTSLFVSLRQPTIDFDLTMSRQWVLTGQEGFEASLEYQTDVYIPSSQELGPNQVLVRMHAASLNYRELVIAGPMV